MHDLTAARAHGTIPARQTLILTHRAYQATGATVRTPYHHREHPEHYQQFNRDHVRLRPSREHAFSRLKSEHIRRRASYPTNHIDRIIATTQTHLACTYSG